MINTSVTELNINCIKLGENLRNCITKINENNGFSKAMFSFTDKTDFTFNISSCNEISSLSNNSMGNNISIKFSKKQYFTQYPYSIKYDSTMCIVKIIQFEN